MNKPEEGGASKGQWKQSRKAKTENAKSKRHESKTA
jgi:hypothetical protein